MKYEKGPYAFFDGTSSTYRKVLQTGDSVAGFKVEAIEHKGVKMTSGTNEIEVPVGWQLRREESGDWHLVSAIEQAGSSYSGRTPSGPPPVTTITRTITVPDTNNPPADSPVIMVDPNAMDPNAVDPNAADPNAPPPPTPAPTMVDPGQAPPTPPTESAPPGSDNEVLRRLMERRQQEENR
jgi:hypothetical protein